MVSDGGTRKLVVVGVDGSAESAAALRWAVGYASETGATVRAVLAWHYPPPVGPAPVGVAPQAVTGEVSQSLAEALDKAVSSATGDIAVRVEQRVGYGHPAQVLIDESREADLLVVGRHGHGAFTSMLIGSVSMHCVTSAHCPVVVVRDTRGE